MKTAKQYAYEHGVRAETMAATYLVTKGYKILERRYKAPVGEIDLVAVKEDMLVVVEVKARAKIDDALLALTPRARRRIEQTTQHFIMTNPEYVSYGIRFDLIAFGSGFRFKHLDNAWFADT